MKGSFSLLVMVAAVLLVGAAACSTAAGGPAVPVGVVYWPPGRYALEATIEYERSTTYEKRTITGELFAELVVTPAGSMFLNSLVRTLSGSLSHRGSKRRVSGPQELRVW